MSDPSPARPTSAGIYDFLLGGDAHNPLDAAAGKKMVELVPQVVDGALANRGFLQRAVRRLAAEYGIQQFIDLGSGLPTQRNTHEVAGELLGEQCRVLYVDHDPVAVTRAQQLLSAVDQAAAIEGDIRAPQAILDHPETHRVIDFDQPVGVLMVAVLHFVTDDDDPWGLVARYVAPLAAGSYLALTHSSGSHQVSDQARHTVLETYKKMGSPATDRSRTEIERFFEGLEMVPPYPGKEPGLAHIGLWGAEDPVEADSEGSRLGYAGVARKP